MSRKISILALFAALSLVLASCKIGGSSPTEEPLTILALNTPQPASNQVVLQSPALTLTTTASPQTYSQVDQQITFTYVIANTGSTSLGPTQFTVTDSLLGATPFPCGSANTILAPNTNVTCTAPYKVTAADLIAVSITSVATASGGGVGPSQPANATVSKIVVTQTSGAAVGNTVPHTVDDGEWIWQIARCYGTDPNKVVEANRQLSDPAQISKGMVLTIPNVGSKATPFGPPCVAKYTVKSGDTWNSIAQQYKADPTILQMVNRNTMTVGSVVIVPINSASGTPVGSSGLTLTTSASPTTYNQAGQQITFTYNIKNSGTTTLGPTQFTVTDRLLTSTPFNCGLANTTLAPNATVTCTAIYTVTQADLNSASISNVATASGGGVGPSQTASTTVNRGAQAQTLRLTTSANPVTYDQAGQQITFNYNIMNVSGSNIGPTQFTVTDTLISQTPFNCGLANTTLAPNATVFCSAIYTVTQADTNAASVSNLATASAPGVTPSSTASTTVNKAVKSIALTTSGSPTTYNQVGQQITFTYVIKNTGPAALGPAQFTVTDTLISPTPFNCGLANSTLAPGATLNCSAIYTITQADLSSVSISNLATASGPGVGPSQAASSTVIKQ